MTRAVPWNSIEFNGNSSAPISMTRAVPWNSMELRGRQFRWHEQFHGIAWNEECANFNDTSSSMVFQGTRSAPILKTRAVLWNSLEFDGTWSAPISLTRAVPWNSLELGVRQFRWHQQFHGIPRNLGCANFADTSSSMEFHGSWCVPISLTRARTSIAPISLTWAVPWNSMELGVHQFRWREQFHGIPWN